MTSSLYRGRPRSCAFFKIHWWDLPTTLGSNTWFSSLESKLIHPNIFPQFIWISRVSWNQFYWLQFDSSFQPYVALFSMCMSHWEQSWVSSTTQFLPCVFGACHSTENEFCKGQRRFEPSRGEWGRKLKAQRTIIYNLNLWPKKPPKDGKVNAYYYNATPPLSSYHSFNKYLLQAYYVPGTIPGTKGGLENGTDRNPSAALPDPRKDSLGLSSKSSISKAA